MLQTIAREAFRTERIPTPALWLLAADGMATWYRWLARGLTEAAGGRREARALVARAAAPAFERRYEALRANAPHLPSPETDRRAVSLAIAGLYRAPSCRKALWVLDGVGGAPGSVVEWGRAWRLVHPLSYEARWREVATHLGEVLIALTSNLPKEGVERTNALLGRLCFDAGVRYGERMRAMYDLPKTPDSAIEVLRTSEYVFRVNPEHWSEGDSETMEGYIEGTACPWYTRPGWGGMHCGIFGQFQSGVSSVFGLRYKLTETIPRHGGHTCRIDLKPLAR